MLWLVIIVTICVLLFVLLAKRPVNTSGLHANWTVPIDPPAKPAQPVQAAPVAPVAPVAPAHVESVNFNDVFAPKKAPSADRPVA